jgi:hypothetical protein
MFLLLEEVGLGEGGGHGASHVAIPRGWGATMSYVQVTEPVAPTSKRGCARPPTAARLHPEARARRKSKRQRGGGVGRTFPARGYGSSGSWVTFLGKGTGTGDFVENTKKPKGIISGVGGKALARSRSGAVCVYGLWC